MDTADQTARSPVAAAQRVDAEDARQASEVASRAFQNRIRAIATNSVLGAMECYGRKVMTDDDAARVDAIERILVLKRETAVGSFVPVVPTEQVASQIDTAVLQLAVEKGLAASNGEKP